MLPPRPCFCRGFTLVEMAISLAIIALISAGAITALHAQNMRNQLLETRAQLSEAREALINFAAVTGALPCPDMNQDGDPDSPCAAGVTKGRLPWRLLGLPSSDVWGQSLHYAVHGSFTDAASLRLGTKSALGINGYNAARSTSDMANPENVVLALWSSGADAHNTAGSENGNILAEAPNSDDVVTWLSRFVLLGRMLEAGRDIPQ